MVYSLEFLNILCGNSLHTPVILTHEEGTLLISKENTSELRD